MSPDVTTCFSSNPVAAIFAFIGAIVVGVAVGIGIRFLCWRFL